MKKLVSILVITILILGSLFATSFKVLDVEGKVFYGTSQNEVQVGDTLEDDVILNVRPQSKITLQPIDSIEKRTFKNPNNKIAVKDIWVRSAIGKQGLKKMTVVKATPIAPDIDRVRPGVQTAASRASEAKEDFTWDE